MTNRDLGSFGEELAEQVLLTRGYRMLARNWRVREGEIDLVALDVDQLVFVEVKARVGDLHGTPEEAVNGSKQAQLGKLAQIYIGQMDDTAQDLTWRIDVIAILLTSDHQVRTIRHYKNAVRFE